MPVVCNPTIMAFTTPWAGTDGRLHRHEPDAVLNAVRRTHCYCVQLPGEQLRIYGPLRLVHYAYFLHRRYFPTQDRLHDTGDLEPVVVYRDAALGR